MLCSVSENDVEYDVDDTSSAATGMLEMVGRIVNGDRTATGGGNTTEIQFS